MSIRLPSENRTDAFAVTSDMTSAEDALQRLLENVSICKGQEQIELRNASGRILALPVHSMYNIPPFDNSAVDGFAMRYQDFKSEGDVHLHIVGRIAAGDTSDDIILKSDQAAQIFTGAPIPMGADTVIPMEVCSVKDDMVTIPFSNKPKQNIRLAGEDIEANTILLKKGIGLRPQDIAIVASVGQHELTVFQKVSIAVFSTGSEITDPSEEGGLKFGKRFDANRFLLMSLCKRLGCEVTDLGILNDDKDLITQTFSKLKGKYDLILTTGGVSTSEEDHVKQAFEAAGGNLDLWKVAIRPGRPLAWGRIGSTYFMGLPGNPVAAFVTYSIFSRPLILKMSGLSGLDIVKIPVRANFEIKKRVGRREWLRVWIKRNEQNQLIAEKFPMEGSGILSSIVVTDGLLELPDELPYVKKGTILDFLPFTPFAPF